MTSSVSPSSKQAYRIRWYHVLVAVICPLPAIVWGIVCLARRRVRSGLAMTVIPVGLYGVMAVVYVYTTDVVATVRASGTVEPEQVIDIGTPVAGRVVFLGRAVGETVEAGTVLAKIDDSVYRANVQTDQKALIAARKSASRAKTALARMDATLLQAQNNWQRAQKLATHAALPKDRYDAYRAAYETAKADVVSGESTFTHCHAAVAKAKAAVDRAKRKVAACTIVSPIKGIVIARGVQIGQTVTALPGAPSLFRLVKDLRHMQVRVVVDEAEIGYIWPGEPAIVKCGSLGNTQFHGRVDAVRFSAFRPGHGMTYTVLVVVNNADGRLRPFLKANVSFHGTRHRAVMLGTERYSVVGSAIRNDRYGTPSLADSTPER